MATAPQHPWQRPKPATDAELDAIVLTVDVEVGNTVFRKGTTLGQLVRQHRAIYRQLYPQQEAPRAS